MKEQLIHLKGFDCGVESNNRVDEVNINEMEKSDCCEVCYNHVHSTSFEYTPEVEKELWTKSKAWNEEWMQAAIEERLKRQGCKLVKTKNGMAYILSQMAKNAVKQGKKVHMATHEADMNIREVGLSLGDHGK